MSVKKDVGVSIIAFLAPDFFYLLTKAVTRQRQHLRIGPASRRRFITGIGRRLPNSVHGLGLSVLVRWKRQRGRHGGRRRYLLVPFGGGWLAYEGGLRSMII